MWSDGLGPNNQFKNKLMAALMKLFEVHFKIKIFWNFFATSHGKGSVDGIGSIVKNRVKRIAKSRKAIVNCADSFNSEHSTVELIYFFSDKFAKIHKELQIDTIFANASPVTNTFSSHQFQEFDSKVIGFSLSKEGYAFRQNC